MDCASPGIRSITRCRAVEAPSSPNDPPREHLDDILPVGGVAGAGVVAAAGRHSQQLTWNNLTSNLSNISNGKLRALAVAAPQRVAQSPSVPTFDELKLPELNLTSWTGLAAPAHTPDTIVSRLYEGMRAVLADPATKLAWEARGAMLPEAITPNQYKQEISQRIQFYRNSVKTHRIVLD